MPVINIGIDIGIENGTETCEIPVNAICISDQYIDIVNDMSIVIDCNHLII